MIEKERLEELIEQGATIYEVGIVDVLEIKLENDDWVEENGTLHKRNNRFGGFNYFYNERLFETEEDAEWHKEFGCIERTERLELPTWEEVVDIIYGGSFGVQTIIKFDKCKFGYKLQLDGNVYIFVDKGTDTLFMGSLTKENYTLACRKAKELFLGKNAQYSEQKNEKKCSIGENNVKD